MSRIYQPPSKQVHHPVSTAPSSSNASVSINKVNLNPTTNASTKIYVNNPSNPPLAGMNIKNNFSFYLKKIYFK